MNKRIIVRTDTSWDDMTIESFLGQNDVTLPVGFIRGRDGALRLWEEATGKLFFGYRALVKDVCQLELEALGLPMTIGIHNINWSGEDEWFLPIDDDDVFFESIKTASFPDDVAVVYWRRMTDYLGQRRFENPAYGGLLDTCNYAVRKSFLLSMHHDARTLVLAKHWGAARVIAEHLGLAGFTPPRTLLERAMKLTSVNTNDTKLDHPLVKYIDECFSVYCLHSASISFLTAKMREPNPVQYLRTLPLHPYLSNETH